MRPAILLVVVIFNATLMLPCGHAKQTRSLTAIAEFKRQSPCPATGERRGRCPGYHVDHVKPLCTGGPDEPANMQWLAVDAHKTKTRLDVADCHVKRTLPSQLPK